MNDLLNIRLLGGLSIERNGEEVTGFASSKARALIAFLACNPGRHRRESLATMLWDDSPQERAMGNLRVVITSIRKLLAPFVDISRHEISLQHDEDVWVDVVDFERMFSTVCGESGRYGKLSIEEAAQLEVQLLLYKGDFLAGVSVRSAQEFEDWARFERVQLRHRVVSCMIALIDHYVDQNEDVKAMTWVNRLIKLDPANERGHESKIVLLIRSNQKQAAVVQYERYCNALASEMDDEPSSRMVALWEQLLDDELPSNEPITQVGILSNPSQMLPAQLTPLIGRRKELDDVLARLGLPECRLLTLVGPGGIGKTRLAVEIVHHFAVGAGVSDFPDGAFFVSLENVQTSTLISTAVAESLGLYLAEGISPDAQITSYLRRHQLLLVLDNVEHLLDAADLFLAILHAAPNVKLLLTSREHLDLHGEWLYEVPGLAFPVGLDLHSEHSLQLVAQYPSVQLFDHEAQVLSPSFSLADDYRSVAKICRQVEGLPLAIQLAAASTRVFPVDQILSRLEQSMDVLQTTMRNMPARHQSLRAVFDHSWALLAASEKDAFRQLAVFSGGFCSDAAEHVAGVTVPMISSLINSSLIELVNTSIGSTVRYKMHAVLRQYAEEKLKLDQEQVRDVNDRHCAYYTTLLDGFGEEPLNNHEASESLAIMASEIENLRGAWRWAVLHGQLQRSERALPAFSRFYLLHGPFQEGSVAIDLAIEELRVRRRHYDSPQVDRLFGKLLAVQSKLYNRQANYAAAVASALETIQAAHDIGQSHTEIEGHLEAAQGYRFLGDYVNALFHSGRALELSRNGEFLQREADSLLTLGTVYLYQAQYESARETLTDALARYRLLEIRRHESRTLNVLGILYLYQGRYSEANSYYEQALHLYQDIGDRQGEAQVLNNLGVVRHHIGDFESAQSQYTRALAIQQELGGVQGVGLCSGNFSLLAQHTSDFEKALTYGETADRIGDELGDRDSQAFALLCIGHAHAGLKQWDKADIAYGRSLSLRRELGQHNQALESQSGLVEVALSAGLIEAVLDDVNQILAKLEGNNLLGIVDPFRIYWICYLALCSVEDARSAEILERAYQLLQQRSELVSGILERHSFVENWPSRQSILEEYLQRGGRQG